MKKRSLELSYDYSAPEVGIMNLVLECTMCGERYQYVVPFAEHDLYIRQLPVEVCKQCGMADVNEMIKAEELSAVVI